MPIIDRTFLIPILLLATVSIHAQESRPTSAPAKPVTITFASGDGLPITADLYRTHPKKAPFIVLCHQARWSRGEYREIAPRLVRMGFNCMAVDQRSGGRVNGVPNATLAAATKKSLGVSYLDARQDVVAALRHARARYAKGKLIAWGSSYSSALVLQIAGSEPKLADGVLSFAPGEYFARLGKSGSWIRESAAKIRVPVFLTGSKAEMKGQVKQIAAVMKKNRTVTAFSPAAAGQHGSRALWRRFPESAEYWKAVTAFLDRHFPRKVAAQPSSTRRSR